MASGLEPWASRNIAQIVGAVTGGRRPALPADTDARLRALIERCWAQDPAARPSAAVLVGELAQLCQGENAEPAASASARLVAQTERRAEAAEADARAQKARASALEADMAALRLRAQEAEAGAAASPYGPGDGTAGGGGGGAADFLLGSEAVETPICSMTPARIVELLRTGGRNAQIAKLACEALWFHCCHS